MKEICNYSKYQHLIFGLKKYVIFVSLEKYLFIIRGYFF